MDLHYLHVYLRILASSLVNKHRTSHQTIPLRNRQGGEREGVLEREGKERALRERTTTRERRWLGFEVANNARSPPISYLYTNGSSGCIQASSN